MNLYILSATSLGLVTKSSYLTIIIRSCKFSSDITLERT